MELSLSDEDSERDVVPQQLLCMACLCGGRGTRRPRDQALIEYYADIVSDVLSSPASVPAPRLCWECEAQLRRALHFTHQVRECFATLQPTLRALGAQGLSACLPVALRRVPRLQRCTVSKLDIPAQRLVPSEEEEFHSSGTEELGSSDTPMKEEYVHEVPLQPTQVPLQPTEVPLLVEIKEEPQEYVNNDPLTSNEILDGDGERAFEESQRRTYICKNTHTATTSESTAQQVSRKSNLKNTMIIPTQTCDISYKCTICEKAFNRNRSLIAHMNVHIVEKIYKCLICQISFGKIGTLKSHIMKTHAEEKSYGCPFCQNVFSNCSDLISHIMTEKPYKCTICLKGSKNKYNMNVHMKIHTGERLFKCPICQKSYVQRSQLKVHMRTHTGEKTSHNCTVCQNSFTSGYRLKSHMRIHNAGKKPFECSICQKGFFENNSLKYHMNTHTGEKPYKCSFCNKGFYCNGNMKDHMKTHTGEKPYQCSVCQKEFSRTNGLKLHMRTHTGEKPYKCIFCQRDFSSSQSLKDHKKTHTGEKPFLCSICPKSFRRRLNLTIHMRSHTGEKPHKCTVCQRGFSQRSSLKGHMKTHT